MPQATSTTATLATDAHPEPQHARPGRRQDRPRGGRGRPPPPVHPVLERLAALHPAIFGPRALPLKLGTFKDLMERHPDVFKPEELKEALGRHTRSTRYLDAVARGVKRHDLDGVPVADMAPEHVHHAVVELFRRKQARSPEDQQPALRRRLRELLVSSGMDRAAYAAAAKINTENFSALIDAADQDQAADIARREALARAFAASGLGIDAFSETYGMSPRDVARTLQQAGDDQRVKASR